MTRASVGLYISHLVPTSHQITNKIGYKGDAQLKFAQVRPELSTQIQNIILEQLEDFELPALVYSVASAVCFAFDIVSFFVCVGIAGKFKKDADKVMGVDAATYQTLQ